MIPQLAARRIPALQGLRAIAISLVVVYHFGFRGMPGGYGVLIFYVLSGFLITWLLLKEDERYGTVSLRRFYTTRALRLLPAFYFFLAFALALVLALHKPVAWSQVCATLFFGANYFQAIHPEHLANSILGHLWSLALEEQFYLLWPVAFLLLRRNRRRLAIVLAVTIVGVWVYRAALVRLGVSDRYIYHAFETRIDHLLVGCLTAVALKCEFAPRLSRFAMGSTWMPLLPGLALAGSAVYGAGHLRYRDAVGFAIDPLLVAFLMVQLIASSTRRPWCWLENPALAWLARISYSLYLYQQVGMSPVRIFPHAPIALHFAACVALSLAMAVASYHLVEKPFLHLKDRLAGSPRSEQRSVPTPGAALSSASTKP